MHPSKHKTFEHLYDICTILDQRQRRWTDFAQMLYKCVVFAGICRHTAELKRRLLAQS